MTQTWEFTLPDGTKMYINLQWKYVPFIEELREWLLANWDLEPKLEVSWESIPDLEDMAQERRERRRDNMTRFYAYADELVESVARPKHPIGWALDKVKDHMDGAD